MNEYAKFLESKKIVDSPTGIANPPAPADVLFDFQRAIVDWSVRRGRAAIFAGTGLGKTAMQCEWSRIVSDYTNMPGLIIAPLAVSSQTIDEARRILGLNVRFLESDHGIIDNGLYITNYQKLHRFSPDRFGSIALDESSIIKNQDGRTRNALVSEWAHVPFRLACTATPAPNDFMEIGNHSEFLGVMSMTEMLATFFVHDGGETQKWRLKGHAEKDFWGWMASWCVCVTHPNDLGFHADGYDLPPLRIHEVIVDCDEEPNDGFLFALPANTLAERRTARSSSVEQRVAKAAEIASRIPLDEQICVWSNLNSESELAAKQMNAVEIAGRHSDDEKAERMLGFASGGVNRISTKPSIAGMGMNWQSCHHVFYIGLSDSWEQFYQSVRRFWRFGQKHPVDVYIVISSQEGAVLDNIKRKDKDAQKMTRSLVAHMKEFTKQELKGTSRMKSEYTTTTEEGNNFTAHLGDCVEGVSSLGDSSIGFTVFSPPFASLYTYSASDRDMGNCATHDNFYQHFKFLVEQLLRVTMPGRLCSFHCMNLPTSKSRDGFIGIRDFRGKLIQLFEDAGWIFHSEVCIWKDPVISMQRTKAIGLLHKQIKKDSCMSRQGIPDYLVTMRKPGDNNAPVDGEFDRYIGDNPPKPGGSLSIDVWQRYASPVWMDINPSDTLQYRSAREHNDERHICPLQLQVIERALELWSNPGDMVLSPFMGIGSEGYVALENKRRFIGFELKESYFKQAVANLRIAEAKAAENSLFPEMTEPVA